MLDNTQAQQALALRANNTAITATDVETILANASTTFAQIVYVTKVKTAAAHKHLNIQKVTSANVQLFSNILAATSVFANAVKKSAGNIATNDPQDITQFQAQSNYFSHTPCYSIVQHKQKGNLYLYAIYNRAQSLYYIDNVLATKHEVAQYLTASEADKLLKKDNTVHNKTYDVTHTVQVRTISLDNIVSITANKQQITV